MIVGDMFNSREALVMNLLHEIGEGLKAKGLTLDELIESGQKIRQQIYAEQ